MPPPSFILSFNHSLFLHLSIFYVSLYVLFQIDSRTIFFSICLSMSSLSSIFYSSPFVFSYRSLHNFFLCMPIYVLSFLHFQYIIHVLFHIDLCTISFSVCLSMSSLSSIFYTSIYVLFHIDPRTLFPSHALDRQTDIDTHSGLVGRLSSAKQKQGKTFFSKSCLVTGKLKISVSRRRGLIQPPLLSGSLSLSHLICVFQILWIQIREREKKETMFGSDKNEQRLTFKGRSRNLEFFCC